MESVQAEALTKAQQELGEVTGELGLAFVKIAKFEEEPGETFFGPSICLFCHKVQFEALSLVGQGAFVPNPVPLVVPLHNPPS